MKSYFNGQHAVLSAGRIAIRIEPRPVDVDLPLSLSTG